ALGLCESLRTRRTCSGDSDAYATQPKGVLDEVGRGMRFVHDRPSQHDGELPVELERLISLLGCADARAERAQHHGNALGAVMQAGRGDRVDEVVLLQR